MENKPYSRRKQEKADTNMPKEAEPEHEHFEHGPEKMTPLMLINEISKMFGATIRSADNLSIDMPSSSRDIIFHLTHHPKLTQLELSQLTHHKPPTISVSLSKLEAEGYVVRTIADDDKRKTYVELTEKGKAVDEEVMKRIKSLDNSATVDLSEDDINTLMQLLEKIKHNMLEGGAVPGMDYPKDIK